jgi:hypothetical protein
MNYLEKHYIKILDNPVRGDVEDLEKKFSEKARQFKKIKDDTGFHLSALEENIEINAAYQYLKSKWDFPSRLTHSINPEAVSCRKPHEEEDLLLENIISGKSLLETTYFRLKAVARSAMIVLLTTASFQFLVLCMGIPSVTSQTESNELILAKAIREEEQIRQSRKKKVFDENHIELNNRLTVNKQPDIIRAARSCDSGKIKSLLARGDVSPHTTNSKLETALHWAARMNCMEIARTLLSLDANPFSKDIAGLSPVDWANRSNHPEMTRLLNNSST